MGNIFIGWSGNKILADNVAKALNNSGHYAIVGGGQPKDMFVGAQIIDQINRCNTAILLIEDKKIKDKKGDISPNLMFEWGYITAKFTTSNIHAFLINKKSKDLPSDLLGSWVNELTFDKSSTSSESIAEEIVDIFMQNNKDKNVCNYFDLINDWKRVYTYLTDTALDSAQSGCEYVLSGCLAAYYYQDNILLRQTLNSIKAPASINNTIIFAKSYIDIFINSENMTKPLSQQDFFNCMQTFEMILNRQKTLSNDVEMLLDILNFDAYGLACALFIKNANIDNETKEYFSEKARLYFEKDIELIDVFEDTFKNNTCLCLLLKSYIYNDIAHLFRDCFNDKDTFLKYLSLSVNERKSLHQTFSSLYPSNSFLSNKLEQEYIISLSEQCNYMENSVMKTMYQKSVLTKFEEWEKELIYTSSLTDRIKNNIKNFNSPK